MTDPKSVTYWRTDGQTQSNMPFQLFQSGGEAKKKSAVALLFGFIKVQLFSFGSGYWQPIVSSHFG